MERWRQQAVGLKESEVKQNPPILTWEFGCASIEGGWRQIFAAQWLLRQSQEVRGWGNLENVIKMLQLLVRDTFPKITTSEGPEPDWRQIHVVAIWMLAILSPYKVDILPSVQHACQVANLVVDSAPRQEAARAFEAIARGASPILGDLWRD
ncbi:MAG TPA: hypothetical protein VFO38_03080 [Candidatus Saccharimonadales bacterium]|nr:hypothetical protein [Candidatus Saccharimonadales bacterium]